MNFTQSTEDWLDKIRKDTPMASKAAVKKSAEQPLPTMENMGIEEIDSAAASLLEVRERYSNVGKEVNEREQSVVAVMGKHGKTFYAHGGLEVEVKAGKTKAKVKHTSSADDE